ncbi:MAG TPA: DEAD/DEAH box helicase [Gemmataceae bacterium]|jgi:ATP-dependent RNA helicase RhlE|nr:DEAD/DEAH box helicase [Gemmataceae bacterium]
MPFSKLGLHATLVAATRRLHYTEPTPIQAEAIPPVLAGRDVIATAQTGTGKTAAFLLPICHGLLKEPRGPAALIITPTRELAQQIESVCRDLTQSAKLRVGLVVGGAAMERQERLLRSGVDLLIATTGRLLDHLRYQPTALNRIGVLVLDEADRMFDMGFLPDIRRVIGKMPGRKQTLLFSATMPPVIAGLAREILKNPVSIQIGRKTAVAVGITQAAYPVADHLKTPLLRHLLRETEMPSVLVFTRTKHSAKKLTRLIAQDGFKVAELHSNRTQAQRTKAMEGFRRGDYQVLVATNIAARGLDVDHITHVISYDVPHVPEDYIHRIGRTARAKAEGDAFVLVSPPEEGCLSQIERQIGQRLPRVTLPDFDYRQAPAPREPREQRGRHGSSSGRSRSGSGLPERQPPKPNRGQGRRR